MEIHSDIDIENSCRTCLALIHDYPDRSFEPIYGLTVENIEFKDILLTTIPEINLDNDKLSQIVCNECRDAAISSYNFQKMASENERNVLMILELRETGVDVDVKIEEILQETTEAVEDVDDEMMLPEGITEELIEELDEDQEEVVDETCEVEEIEPEYADDVDLIQQVETVENVTEIDATTEDDLKTSLETLHTCDQCPKTFKKLSLLNRHQKTHSTDKRSHECTKCHKKLPSEVALVRHGVLHSDIVTRSEITRADSHKFTCVICNNQFKSPETLASHHKSHKSSLESARDIPCRLCAKIFETFTDIVRHSRNHVENATHQCVICKKFFILNDEAIDHFLRHKGQKPHKCPICQKSFLKLHKLNIHMKIHEDDKVR